MEHCGGKHRFYVAETIGVPLEGKVHVVALCCDCGEGLLRSYTIAEPSPQAFILGGTQNKKGNQND